MRTYDISRPPELINIGFDGENKWRPRGFNCAGWLKKHPDGIITLWVQPEGVRKAFPVSTTKIENTIVWYPLSEELYPGTGELQLTIQDGEYVGKSDTIKFEVNKSLVSGGAHPDGQPSWATKMVDDVTAQANRAAEAADRAEQAYEEEVISEAIEDYFSKHPVVVEETDPTVPTWAKNPQKPSYTAAEVGALPDTYTPPVTSVNGKTGAVALSASDVHALPDSTVIPTVPQMATDPDLTDWTAGKTVDAATLATDFAAVGNAIAAKYTKPSGGIPASDLADGVIPSLSGYATEAWVQQQGYGTYSKPSGGIPASDLEAGVIPTVPTKVSELNNDVGYLTAHQSLAAYRTSADQDTIDAAQDTAIASKYSKPSDGIPASDLASGVIPDISGKANAADVYTKTEIDQKLVGAMDYKGTKETVSELPTSGNNTGDVWHIIDDGSEWAWNGSTWEELGTAVDLSGYRTASAQDTIDAAQNTAIAAKYSKPSSGIPASDLAAGVIPDISSKQDAPLIGQAYDSTAANYVTPYQVVTALEAGKDVVVEWHDNDFGTLYFTAWNTSHLGNVVVAVSNTAATYNGSLVLFQFGGNMQTGAWNAVPSIVAQISDLSGYATQTWVQQQGYLTQHQDISGKADKITVTASDNGKFMRVVNGAWAAVEVPSAESTSFGGDTT